MTETKFTPGPYTVIGEDSVDGVPFIEIASGAMGDKSFKSICEVRSTLIGDDFVLTEADEATTHLLAAGPDLYEALEQATAWMSAVNATHQHLILADVLDLAKTALKSARGEPQ